MLNNKQKAQLKKQAHTLTPIFQVGKEGVNENMCIAISLALEAKELIKVKVLETSPASKNEVMIELSRACRCEVVGSIGRIITLYKRSNNNPKIQF